MRYQKWDNSLVEEMMLPWFGWGLDEGTGWLFFVLLGQLKCIDLSLVLHMLDYSQCTEPLLNLQNRTRQIKDIPMYKVSSVQKREEMIEAS